MPEQKLTVKSATAPAFIHPLELKLAIVCDACGSVMEASWITREEAPREIIIAVEKCPCDSPILKN